MWNHHRQARRDSRKRAMRAAQARAARRGGGGPAPAPEAETAEDPPQVEEPQPNAAPDPEPPAEPLPVQHDPAGNLVWVGLVLLTLILGGFMAALLFMLG